METMPHIAFQSMLVSAWRLLMLNPGVDLLSPGRSRNTEV